MPNVAGTLRVPQTTKPSPEDPTAATPPPDPHTPSPPHDPSTPTAPSDPTTTSPAKSRPVRKKKPTPKKPHKKPAKPAPTKPRKRARSRKRTKKTQNSEFKIQNSGGADNPFIQPTSTLDFVRGALNDYRLEHHTEMASIKKQIAAADVDIARAKKSRSKKNNLTALIEARNTLVSAQKTTRSNYAKFLMQLSTNKALMDSRPENQPVTINLHFPDIGKITVVQTQAPPSEDIATALESLKTIKTDDPQ